MDKKIFISHSSLDTEIGEKFVDALIDIGIPKEIIFFSSRYHTGVELGKDFHAVIKDNIKSCDIVIFLLTRNFYNSAACLNEMGAAWVVQCDYTNIYTPNFSFGNPKYHQCAVDTRKMGAVLKNDDHCRAAMIELKNKILELFNLENDEINNAVLLNKFMQQISAE